jgi:hypothetical protein
MKKVLGTLSILLVISFIYGLSIVSFYPQILLEDDDAHAVNLLQSEFVDSCDCQAQEIERQRTFTGTGDTGYYNKKCKFTRSMWEINNEIKDILEKKYSLIPTGLFTKVCDKVPADYEN